MERETDNPLVSTLRDHYARAWTMWEEMIGSVPDDEWRRSDVDQMIPARHLVHVLVCADSFVRDIPFDQYDPTALFGGGSWGMAPEELPTRQVSLAKLGEIRAMVQERLSAFDDAALLQPEQVHTWTGQTRLGKMLYVLRHTQHHLGEMTGELKKRGIRAYRRWD